MTSLIQVDKYTYLDLNFVLFIAVYFVAALEVSQNQNTNTVLLKKILEKVDLINDKLNKKTK
jgi:hypothetical protein